MASPSTLQRVFTSEHDGQRLDRGLAALVARLSRAHLQELIRSGAVRLAGEVVTRPGTTVRAGQAVEVELRERLRTPRAPGQPAEFEVLFEDEHLAVISKPAGLLAHPAGRSSGPTVAELATARWGELPTLQGADRPGVVHRLDAGTSGVMLIARTREAMSNLMNQFRRRSVAKTYLALCYGEARFDTGWIETPIERSAARPERMEIAGSGTGRVASTYYEVIERLEGFVLLSLHPKTGRTHQLRVHLASIELPIVGDRLYKRRGAHPVRLPQDAPQIARQALHAWKIRFLHPASGVEVKFEAPLADDFAALVGFLRARP